MSFDNMSMSRSGRTLALRLTLWYASIFAAFSIIAVLAFYVSVSSLVQRRTDHGLLIEVSEMSSISRTWGEARSREEALGRAIGAEAKGEGIDRVFLRILTESGEVVEATDMSYWKDTSVNRGILERIAGGEGHVLETVRYPERPYKVRVVYGGIGEGRILQMGLSLEEDERFLETIRRMFGACLAVIIAFSALIGWFLAKHALSGIEKVTETALEISNGDFERRVTFNSKDDEIIRLSTAFNRMLDRIHRLITGMREVTDNIAHDIKTPITRIRGLAEAELNRASSWDSRRDLAADTMEECDQLLQMINTMLMIAEAESGAAKLSRNRVDLAGLVRDVSDLFRPVAEEKGIALVSDLPDRVLLCGDRSGLQRLMANLIENALKYTHRGTVKVSIQEQDHHVSIVVQDTGVGISEHDMPHLFKRLYRCDASRSQPGFGLGLSLAMAVARAHGGDIAVSSKTGEGSTFTVNLPL